MNIFKDRAKKNWLPAAPVLLTALLSACATLDSNTLEGPDQAEIIAEKLDSYAATQGEIRHDVDDENVARLWQESEILIRNGDFDNATAKLQQALEITPNDPVIWSRVAELSLEQNSNLRAENFAAKSNFLAAVGNRPLRFRNWLIIQRAREARGDLLGAREAELESTNLHDQN